MFLLVNHDYGDVFYGAYRGFFYDVYRDFFYADDGPYDGDGDDESEYRYY